MVTYPVDQPFSKQSLVSFDGTTEAICSVYRPDRYRDLKKLVTSLPKICLKGAGLSYTLASSAADIPTVDLKCFNRLLHFDPVQRTLKVEPGLRLGNALQWAVRNGFNIGVLPGHPSITIGGCVAFNVHGKSQFSTGNFENIVESLTLFHPDHGEIVCNRKENSELFWLTIGGMGLTGLILDVTLILTPLKGAQIERTAISCDNLNDAFAKMTALEHQFDYLYSWNNFCRSGDKFGRGVLYAEKFIGDASNPVFGKIHAKLKPVAKRPSVALFNGKTAPWINRIYECKERLMQSSTIMDVGPATFPIAGKEFYFSLLGKTGFIEYQCIFPSRNITDALKKFSILVEKFGIKPSLGSTKFFRGQTRNLCFQMDGFCIAIDIPIAGNQNVNRFLSKMDDLVTEFGGIANIAKDSRITRETTKRMYSEYDSFWNSLSKWDANRRFVSALRSRIEPV